MEKTMDRRVKRTRSNLMKSLTTFMKDKPIRKITVTELTAYADVNRSTFYLYYKDIYDMVETIETEILEELSHALKNLYLQGSDHENVMKFFLFVFDFIKENEDFCKVFFSPNGDVHFLNRFIKTIIESRPPYTSRMGEISSSYFLPFIISGCIGALQQWIETDMKDQPEDITNFIIQLVTEGALSLNEK